MLCFLRKGSILSKLNVRVGNSVWDFPVTNSFCFVSTTGALVVVLVYWGITSATTTSEGVFVLQFALVSIQIWWFPFDKDIFSVQIVKVCHSSALVDWGKRGWSNREKYHMNYPTCLLHNCSPPRESPTSRNPTIHCAPHWISIQRISPKKKSLHRMKFQRNGHISSREIVLGVKFFS